MLKNMGDKGIELLTKVCNRAWSESQIPKDCEVGVILPIFKKGDRCECSPYRGITLLSIPSKVHERILEKRLLQEVDSEMEQSQSGFRKGRSIQDHMFTIKKLIQNARNSSTELYQAFIYLEKAIS
ncbi:uncharacterized protein [Diabrotica undecimpunctata]|uniref:uncharacterized protein n=1 Tax=Diabrotica undecimpunctata TaxID=50387 RepID=UPI003B6341B3